MILLNLDPKAKKPLYLQVYEQIKTLIENGSLKEGDRLPSSRALSEQLSLNRTTIYKAYEELWAMGYLESKQGSYTTVRKRQSIPPHKSTSSKSIIDWEQFTSERHKNIQPRDIKSSSKLINPINFRPLSPDPKLMPIEDFRKSLNKILQLKGSTILDYGNVKGYEPLRKLILQMMNLHQINANENEILITNGTQNSMDLILKAFVKDDSRIAIASPGYSSAIPLFQFHSSNIVEIPLNENGLDLDELESKLKQSPIQLLYTMPNFQNPTGITTSQIHRERLLKICQKHQIILIEDGFEEEMKYFDKAILPIKSMDIHGQIIYLGTFSKILFPGIRLSWIIAPAECIKQLSKLKSIQEISGNTLTQAAVYEFCKSGGYEIHKKRIHKIYKKRMHGALSALRNHMPENVKFTKPLGGYTIWLEVKNLSLSEEKFIEYLSKKGVSITGGSNFYLTKAHKTEFRISIAHTNEEEIQKGIAIIGQSIKELTA